MSSSKVPARVVVRFLKDGEHEKICGDGAYLYEMPVCFGDAFWAVMVDGNLQAYACSTCAADMIKIYSNRLQDGAGERGGSENDGPQ